MKQYHKIKTVFKRDPSTNHKTLLVGEYSIPEFEYLKDNEWVFTEKVDGTNIRIMWDGERVTFGGKSDNSQIQTTLYDTLANMFQDDVSYKLFTEKFGTDGKVCLYGEGYGAKIQKGGGNYCQDQSLVLFDVKIGDWWLNREDVEDIARYLNVSIVPIIGQGTLSDMVEITRNGFTSKWGNFQAEGIVARPKTELVTRSGSRVITKIKGRDFLHA